MNLLSAFEIPEDYPYAEPYSHEQGENRGWASNLYKEIGVDIIYDYGIKPVFGYVGNNWNSLIQHNSYSPYNDFMFFGP